MLSRKLRVDSGELRAGRGDRKAPIRNPKSTIPNPQSPIPLHFGRWLAERMRERGIGTLALSSALQLSTGHVRLILRSESPELTQTQVRRIAARIGRYPAEVHDILRESRPAAPPPRNPATPTPSCLSTPNSQPSTAPAALLTIDLIPVMRCACGSCIPYQTIRHTIPADSPGDTRRLTRAWCPHCDRVFEAVSILRCATWIPTETRQLAGASAERWRKRLKKNWDPSFCIAA